MGMFDYLYVNIEKLPISEKEKKALGKKHAFQTKDFDCMMTEIYITDEGELKINKFSYGWDETKMNGFGTMGVMTRENEEIITEPLHGMLNFYTSTKDDIWFEFMAKFTDGKLEKIERISEFSATDKT